MGNIPVFVDDYHLPPGVHVCSMEDVEKTFLATQTREKRWKNFVDMLSRLYELNLIPESILINGSFVTGRREPGDVDFAALIPPQVLRDALSAEDGHDAEGARLFMDPNNQVALRNLFGAHLLVAHDEHSLEQWSSLFRKGQYGKLREPDSSKDPEWVTTPPEKGIIKVDKEDVLDYLSGGE